MPWMSEDRPYETPGRRAIRRENLTAWSILLAVIIVVLVILLAGCGDAGGALNAGVDPTLPAPNVFFQHLDPPLNGYVNLPDGPVHIASNGHTVEIQRLVLRHEFVHWILYHSGKLTDTYAQLYHQAPEFNDCIRLAA
jgi:hypothetical protein